MPLHPAAPEDLPGLVAAYAQTVRAVIDLGRACSDADFRKDTDCPGWTVKDQISHVVGVEQSLAGAALPRVRVPEYAHVHTDLDRATEAMIELRRPMIGSKVVDELEGVLATRLAQLGSEDLTLDTVIPGALGPGPAGTVLRTRIVDIWTHEQDLRHALGRPGDLDSPGAAVFMDVLFSALPRLVAKNAGIEPGNVVIFDITGPVMGRAGVRLEVGENGKPLGTPLFTGTVHDHPEDEQVTSITLSTDAIARRAAGRGSLEDIHYTVHGDEDVARRVLKALPFTP
ncbi:MAG TPA: maleylpyruvate isomerase family mycothiol-dependent enzyme, partial [Pedococcus sp.]|nr:maleylpyruvate isomerase family mycothiol-dependent enzyme [Pedococcus sp.]